jgi:hypothetical protein
MTNLSVKKRHYIHIGQTSESNFHSSKSGYHTRTWRAIKNVVFKMADQSVKKISFCLLDQSKIKQKKTPPLPGPAFKIFFTYDHLRI